MSRHIIIDYKEVWAELRDFIMISIGSALYCAAVTFFMLPYELTTGGVSGVSLVVYYCSGIPVQLTYAAINVVFLLAAVKVLGWRFCVKTIFAVSMSTLWLWLFQFLARDPVTQALPHLVGDELFMACVLGSIIMGVGLSFCFLANGSMGGTDIIAAMVNKYKDVSLGQMIMSCDIIIISSCYFVFNDWQRVIFGFVFLILSSITLDYCVRRQHQSVEFKIFSRNHTGIAAEITRHGFGVTVLEGKGWWTQTERKVLICIVRKSHTREVMRYIKKIDPYAFFSVTRVQSVYGEGFDTVKTRLDNQKPILVFVTSDEQRLEKMHNALDDYFDLRSTEDIGCDIKDARYIKRFYAFNAFQEDGGHIILITGTYNNVEQEHRLEGPDAVKQLIALCTH